MKCWDLPRIVVVAWRGWPFVLAGALYVVGCRGATTHEAPGAGGNGNAGGDDAMGGNSSMSNASGEVTSVGGGEATAGGGEATAGGGKATAGAAGETAETCPESTEISCIDCNTGNLVTAAQCTEGEWLCPGGTIDRELCPGYNCPHGAPRCCDTTNGHEAYAECLDKVYAPCPEGTVEYASTDTCQSEASDVESCLDLEGLPCESDDLQCHGPTPCSAECYCESDGALGLRWSCFVTPC